MTSHLGHMKHGKNKNKIMRTYFNTTEETKQKEIDYEQVVTKQDMKVLKILRKFKRPMTAHQIHSIEGNMLLTSIRRSLTNLLNEGVLEKGDLVMERYGRRNYQYKLV